MPGLDDLIKGVAMPITRTKKNQFGARATFDTGSGTAYIYRLNRLEEMGVANVSRSGIVTRDFRFVSVGHPPAQESVARRRGADTDGVRR